MSAIGRSRHACRLVCAGLFAGILTIISVPALAQPLSFLPLPAPAYQPAFPQYAPPNAPQSEEQAGRQSDDDQLPPELRRQVVVYQTPEAPGTIVIDTAHKFLYLTLGNGRAMRYGIGVGRQGFTWSGVERITRKAEWPDWIPPVEMVARQPYLPRWVAGGPGNPLGARAMYLGNTEYRIHGTNDPSTIGKNVSSGCIRLQNADVEDLYNRVAIGTKVIVLPATAPRAANDSLSAERNRAIAINQTGNGRMTAQVPVLPAADRQPAPSASRYAPLGIY
jgi:lipoprotein-anchoring transpeptidase ErfK/SrfK